MSSPSMISPTIVSGTVSRSRYVARRSRPAIAPSMSQGILDRLMDAPSPTSGPRPPASEAARLGARFQEAARILNNAFLDKQEIIRLMLVSVIAGEHMLIVGPP